MPTRALAAATKNKKGGRGAHCGEGSLERRTSMPRAPISGGGGLVPVQRPLGPERMFFF